MGGGTTGAFCIGGSRERSNQSADPGNGQGPFGVQPTAGAGGGVPCDGGSLKCDQGQSPMCGIIMTPVPPLMVPMVDLKGRKAALVDFGVKSLHLDAGRCEVSMPSVRL